MSHRPDSVSESHAANPSHRAADPDQDRERARKLGRLLDDLRQFARSAERITAQGRTAYFDPDDDLLRRAGRSVIIDVSAAVDRLPDDFRDSYPDIPWRNIRDTRNYLAHQYETVRDDLIWEALRTHVPDLVRRITATPGDASGAAR